MHETEKLQPELQELLQKPIRDLGLKIEGSPLERLVQQLYRELASKKLTKFHPACYLTDEWGCPSGEPVIGIPFYLAHPDLAHLERETNDLEDSREIMMYLRHEAGHAFNYAYKLHKTAEWKQLFGPFRRPYHKRPIMATTIMISTRVKPAVRTVLVVFMSLFLNYGVNSTTGGLL